MLRKLAVVATVLSLLGLTVSIISPAVSDSRYEERTVRLADKFSDDDQTDIDVGEAGFGVGDYFVFGNDPVFNRARTTKRGTASGSCTLVAIEAKVAAHFECDATIYLEGGSLTVEGGFEDSDQGPDFSPFAVTGGTGDYKTAHGTFQLAQDAEGLLFTFKLLL